MRLYVAHIEVPLLELGPVEWGAVVLSSLIIFAIIGPGLVRDIKRWMS